MTPTLITPPVAMPVTLAEAKEQCRIVDAESDARIEQMIGAAVAELDGYSGILGRCIMPQTWRVTASAGEVVLPFPDVTGATFGGQPLTVTLSALGPVVTLTEGGDVTFTCAMPPHILAMARSIVLLMVHAEYEVSLGSDVASFRDAIDRAVSRLRWWRV